jgi:hypothetical protein
VLASGYPTTAAALLERQLGDALRNGLVLCAELAYRARTRLAAAHLAVARGAETRAGRLAALRRAEAALRPIVASDDPVYEGAGFRLMGLAAAIRGERGAARRWLDRAVASLSDRGEAPELAAALLARGALFGSTDDGARGRAIVEGGGLIAPALREGSPGEWP